jgi:hypothetical protein
MIIEEVVRLVLRLLQLCFVGFAVGTTTKLRRTIVSHCVYNEDNDDVLERRINIDTRGIKNLFTNRRSIKTISL